MMNRRTFAKACCRLAIASAVLPSLILTGCSNTTIADFVTLIAKDAATLATYFGQSSLATQITNLASQIAVDITNWQSGSAATDAIAAINDLIGLINLIPIAVPYAPLIILILSALTGLLALLPSSTPNRMTAATRDIVNHRNIIPIQYGGYDKKHMTAGAKSFNTQWATLSAGLPLTK
jgi:hypothetical protein